MYHQTAEQVVAFLKALQLSLVELGVVFLAVQVVGNVFQFHFQVLDTFL